MEPNKNQQNKVFDWNQELKQIWLENHPKNLDPKQTAEEPPQFGWRHDN